MQVAIDSLVKQLAFESLFTISTSFNISNLNESNILFTSFFSSFINLINLTFESLDLVYKSWSTGNPMVS